MRSNDLMNSLRRYREARKTFLKELDRPDSNRDPLAEFSEKLAEVRLNAKRVERREQKGYDLTSLDGQKIEVKYVAELAKENGDINWKNWHTIKFNDGRDKYALVVFVDLMPKYLFVFTKGKIKDVCRELGKRHPNQEATLQFTKTNYYDIINNKEKFSNLGVETISI